MYQRFNQDYVCGDATVGCTNSYGSYSCYCLDASRTLGNSTGRPSCSRCE